MQPFASCERLYSTDPRERAEAACQIGRRHAEAAGAIPVLLSMLSDDVPVPAIECEMSPWLRRTLAQSPDARKCMEISPAKEAAEALGNIGNLAVPGLLQALAHSDWKTRKFAAVGLGEVDRIDPHRYRHNCPRTIGLGIGRDRKPGRRSRAGAGADRQ